MVSIRPHGWGMSCDGSPPALRPTWPSCCPGTGSRRRLEPRLRVRAVESSTLVADTKSLTLQSLSSLDSREPCRPAYGYLPVSSIAIIRHPSSPPLSTRNSEELLNLTKTNTNSVRFLKQIYFEIIYYINYMLDFWVF